MSFGQTQKHIEPLQTFILFILLIEFWQNNFHISVLYFKTKTKKFLKSHLHWQKMGVTGPVAVTAFVQCLLLKTILTTNIELTPLLLVKLSTVSQLMGDLTVNSY
jgi:hypothetical protein